MAGPDTGGKRPRAEGGGGGDRKRNRHRYARGASGGNVSRTLPHGSRGFVVSCDPRHEVQCFREAYVLLAEQIEARWPELGARLGGPRRTAEVAPAGDGGSAGVAATPAAGVADAVADEVKALRESKKAHGVLQNVDLGVQGSVFVRVVDEAIAVEEVVESVLRAARENGNPGSRHCVRFVPAHATCYAKPEDAAAAAAKVCLRHFPAGKCTYGIQFRGRMNTSAKRDEYVKACADAVEAAEPGRFSVNLSEPDVVLCVEVIKTQCVVGAFRHYYELAKLNIREVCKAKEVVEKEKERAAELQLAAEARKRAEVGTAAAKEGGERAEGVEEEGAGEGSGGEEASGARAEEAAVQGTGAEPAVDAAPKAVAKESATANAGDASVAAPEPAAPEPAAAVP